MNLQTTLEMDLQTTVKFNGKPTIKILSFHEKNTWHYQRNDKTIRTFRPVKKCQAYLMQQNLRLIRKAYQLIFIQLVQHLTREIISGNRLQHTTIRSQKIITNSLINFKKPN